MLAGYKERKKELAIFAKRDEKTEFLEKCLANIDDYERDILVKTYMEGVSVRSYSRESGFSRETINKERKRILGMLAKFFNVMFGN